MITQTLEQLRKLHIAEDEHLKLRYFFYTGSLAKAANLALELETLEYTVKYGVSEGDKNLFIVTGLTNRMQMANDNIIKWTNKMCELGYIFECDFDGWETYEDK